MMLTRFKPVVALLLTLTLLGAGAGWLGYHTRAAEDANQLKQPKDQVLNDLEQKHIRQIIDPNLPMDLVLNRSRLLVFKTSPKRVQVANENILDYLAAPNQLFVTGRGRGRTVLNLWFAGEAGAPDDILSYLVRIDQDDPKMPVKQPGLSATERKHIVEMVDPKRTLDLIVNMPRLLIFKTIPRRILSTDEAVASWNFIEKDQLSLMGLKPGTTTLTFLFPSGKDQPDDILSYFVRVQADPYAAPAVDPKPPRKPIQDQ